MAYQMSANKIIEVILTMLKNGVIDEMTAKLCLYKYSDWLIVHAQKDGVKCPTCEQLTMPF